MDQQDAAQAGMAVQTDAQQALSEPGKPTDAPIVTSIDATSAASVASASTDTSNLSPAIPVTLVPMTPAPMSIAPVVNPGVGYVDPNAASGVVLPSASVTQPSVVNAPLDVDTAEHPAHRFIDSILEAAESLEGSADSMIATIGLKLRNVCGAIRSVL